MEKCKYCYKEQVVPVLDKEMEQQPLPGNKFRKFCLSCERWLPMCSTDYFRTHPNPHILPIGENDVIPLSESEATETRPISELLVRETESIDTFGRSSGVHSETQDREYRNEVLIECILDLTLDRIIDKETATQYLSQQLRE